MVGDLGRLIASAATLSAARRLRYYGRAGHARTRSGDGWLAVATGVWANDMNGVCSEPSARVPTSVVEELLAWFAEQALPASWLLTEDDPALAAALVAAGARSESTGYWVGRRSGGDLRNHAAPQGVTIGRVRTEADLEEWLQVAGQCGWTHGPSDIGVLRRLYRSIGLEDAELKHWIARRGGRAVGMASSFLGPDGVLDLCNLAVVESERRQGIGQALVGVRVHAAATRASTTLIVSAVSPAGWELYKFLGFESVPVVPDRRLYLPVGRPVAL